MGFDGTCGRRAKATETSEVRNVKLGLWVPITMYLTTKKRFQRNHPLKELNKGQRDISIAE